MNDDFAAARGRGESRILKASNQHQHEYQIDAAAATPACHLTDACWKSFGKFVRSHDGWTVKRREATAQEKASHGQTRKGECWWIDAIWAPVKAKSGKRKAADMQTPSIATCSKRQMPSTARPTAAALAPREPEDSYHLPMSTLRAFTAAIDAMIVCSDLKQKAWMLRVITYQCFSFVGDLCDDPCDASSELDGQWGENQELPGFLSRQYVKLRACPEPEVRDIIGTGKNQMAKLAARLQGWHKQFGDYELETEFSAAAQKADELVKNE